MNIDSVWYCGSQGSDDLDALKRYRSMYAGKKAETIQAIRARFVHSDLRNTKAEDSAEPDRVFPIVNELAVVMNARIESVPLALDFTHKLATKQKSIRDWAAGRVTREGFSFYAIQHLVRRNQERDGVAAIVAWDGGERRPMLAVRDVSGMRVHTDAFTGEVTSVAFKVTAPVVSSPDGESETLEIEEIYTAESRMLKVAGREPEITDHGLGVIPVVLIPRTIEEASPIGVSGIAELEEAYLAYLWAWHEFFVAVKLEAHGIYSPTDAVGPLTRESGAAIGNVRMSPGGYFPIPSMKIGGNINVEAFIQNLERTETALYELGRVRKSEDTDMRSGKALVIDTRPMQDYVNGKLIQIRLGYERVADLWAWISGDVAVGEHAEFSIEVPEVEDDDPAENTRRGELFLKGKAEIPLTTEQVLTAWQRFGLIDEDEDITDMVEAIEEDEEASQAGSMAAAVELLRQQPPPQQPQQQTPPMVEDDEEAEESNG